MDRSWLGRLATATIIVLLGVVILMLLWASNRGFDQTDEGYYLLSYTYPQAGGGVSQFDRLVHALLPSASIRTYRLVALVLQVSSAAFLGWAFLVFRRRILPSVDAVSASPVLSLLFVVLAGLQGYSWLPQTLSYNTINGALLNIEIGLTLLAIVLGSRPRPRRALASACGAGVGVAAAVQLFVKFPSALCAAALCAAAALWFLGLRRGLEVCGAMVAAGLASLVLAAGDRVFNLDDLIEGSRSGGASGHSPASILTGYLADLAPWSLFRPVIVLAALAMFTGVALVWRPDIVRRRVWAWALVGIGSVVIVTGLASVGPIAYGGGRLFPAVFTALAICALLAHRYAPATVPDVAVDRRPRWSLAGAIGLLLLAPLAGAFGSDNPIFLQGTASAAPWGAALLLGYASVLRRVPDRARHLVAAVPVLVFAAVMAGQEVRGTVFFPYRVSGSLFAQDQQVPGSPALDGLLVDSRTRTYFEALERNAREQSLVPGEPVLGVDGLAGAVFVLGGRAPGANWVSRGDAGATCDKWRSDVETLKRTRLLLRRVQDQVSLEACLREIWPELSSRTVAITTVRDPAGQDVEIAIVDGPPVGAR